MTLAPALCALLDRAKTSDGMIIALTGAGISAESGIPTFRGEEGYWTVDSSVYHPQELATKRAFRRMPDGVWHWYLYRRTVCRRAAPNPAHEALVRLEKTLGNRFLIVTQNVDGLHLRAGNSMERTYQVHGNIDYMRCSAECTTSLYPVPDIIGEIEKTTQLSRQQLDSLRCPACGTRSRPHVLWFDESYDEPLYRFESSIQAANRAALIVIVGTSASTNLPWHVVETGARLGAGIVDINIADNPFAQLAAKYEHGYAHTGSAASTLPAMAAYLGA